jgi:hypothetical protein
VKNHFPYIKLGLTVILIIGTSIVRSEAQDACISGDTSMLIKAAQCYAKAVLRNDLDIMGFLSTKRNKMKLGLTEDEKCNTEIDKMVNEAPSYEYTDPEPKRDGTFFIVIRVREGEVFFVLHLYIVNEKGCWKVDREAIVADMSNDIMIIEK